MIGYGPEDDNFVLELTYNYGISEYRHGNDYISIDILKKDVSSVVATGAKLGIIDGAAGEGYKLETNGYQFNVFQDSMGKLKNAMRTVIVNCCVDVYYYLLMYSDSNIT